LIFPQIATSVPGDAMENLRIKVEPEEQIDATENAEPAERDLTKQEVEVGMFESVMIKVEPQLDARGDQEDEHLGSCVDVEEYPVKLEQCDPLICDLPVPNTDVSDQEQLRDIGKSKIDFF
jgi:hypothetical protein